MQLKYTLATLAAAAPVFAGRIYPRQNGGGLQQSLTLSPDLVQPASARTGQEDPTDGQVDSEQSVNNFINYCAQFQGVPLTNGEQISEGSCNGIVMGQIMAKDKMPSAMVFNPKNGAVIEEGTDINFQVKVRNIETGHFTNAQLTYYAAPARLNNQGILIGHQHVTVNEIKSLDDTEPQDISKFAFFKGLNDPADGQGILSAVAAGGLKAGVYRVCTMGSSSNHAPIIPPVAQRASGEDCARFTVTPKGGNGGNNGQQGGNNGQQGGNNGQNGQQGGQNGQQGGQNGQQGGAQNGQNGQQGQNGQNGAQQGQQGQNGQNGAQQGQQGAQNGQQGQQGQNRGGQGQQGQQGQQQQQGQGRNGQGRNGQQQQQQQGQGRNRNGQKRSNLSSSSSRRSFSPSQRSRIAKN